MQVKVVVFGKGMSQPWVPICQTASQHAWISKRRFKLCVAVLTTCLRKSQLAV